MSQLNAYYNAVNAGKVPPFHYPYLEVENDLAKLGWTKAWDRKESTYVFLPPWSGVEVTEKPNAHGKLCDVGKSGCKPNVDYFLDTKDLTRYLWMHGFNRVEAQDGEEGRAARRLSSLPKPDVVAVDKTNVVAAQKAAPRSRKSVASAAHRSKKWRRRTMNICPRLPR